MTRALHVLFLALVLALPGIAAPQPAPPPLSILGDSLCMLWCSCDTGQDTLPLLLGMPLLVDAATQPQVYRVEGNAVEAQPDFPVSADVVTFTYADPADEDQPILVRGLDQARGWIEESATGATTIDFLRVNRAYWHGTGTGPTGLVTLKIGPVTVSTIQPGAPSAFDCVFSIGPGRADVVLRKITGTATIWHRAGNSPHSAKIVDVDSGAAGIGDFYAVGVPGEFVQFELVR